MADWGRRAERKNRLAVATVLLHVVILGASMTASADSCVSCHTTLNSRNAHPVELWQSDIHRRAGFTCSDCHGGDPGSIEGAMAAGAGFRGAPGGMESVRLCGECHSDTERIRNPVLPTGQMERFLSGPHGKGVVRGAGGPTCVTCHGAHGVLSTGDPCWPLFGTGLAGQCLVCHGESAGTGLPTASGYLEGIHFKALSEGFNLKAPGCTDCHGAHRAMTPDPVSAARICGRCHTRELEYFMKGPHNRALLATGQPACTDCHDHHRTQATGVEELTGQIADRCQRCHPTGSPPWEEGLRIDRELTRAMDLFGELAEMSRDLSAAGIRTEQIDLSNREAYSWLIQVESALHSADSHWEELTGMAKVKMMASWNMAMDHYLERRIRRAVFFLLGLLWAAVLVLLAVKLRLVERDQDRRHALGSPEARQREQERHGR